ncbi:mechanosensitive ion channel family protein [Hydrogenophaga sp.]|uniref:mechanosensitive ion channel family protein n=1 Tax=Hydrogenophaga sp. TaxID=1904254 RepID=UPI003569A926
MEALNTPHLIEMLITYGTQALLALLVLFVGLWLTGWIARRLDTRMERLGVEETLRRFLRSLIGLVLKVLLLISVASMVGIATTSFIAVLGAAGLAIGLALQGSLSNFAGGVLLILFKPYKVGDVVEMQGEIGTVQSIQILNTVLKTADNKTVFMPNGPVANGNIINYSTQATRRVDMTFGISYTCSIDLARQTLQQIIAADERILQEPAPLIVVGALADSSVNFTVRVWTASGDYWPVFFHMQEQVKKSFDEVGLSIPFPQRDVHLINAAH